MAAQGSWQMRKVSCGPPPQAADLTPAMAWGSRCHVGGLGLFPVRIAAKTLQLLGSWWEASSGVSNPTEGSEPPKPGLRRPLPLEHKPDPQGCPSEHGQWSRVAPEDLMGLRLRQGCSLNLLAGGPTSPSLPAPRHGPGPRAALQGPGCRVRLGVEEKSLWEAFHSGLPRDRKSVV